MRKYFLVVFCLVLLFVVTGCGNKNQVVCTQTETEGGVTVKGTVTVDFDKDDKLTDATAVYDIGNKTTADQYCALMKLVENPDKGVKVECSGSKVTIKGFANADLDEDEEQVIGMTKADFIQKMQAEGLTCK